MGRNRRAGRGPCARDHSCGACGGCVMHTSLVAVFWVSVVLVAYSYAGYPLLVRWLAWLRPRPVRRADIQPSVTLIIAAYNEQATIEDKLENALSLDYPR